MNVVDTVKNAAFASAIQAALNYMDKDPETNIPKVMSIVDKAAPEGWYESQRNAIRQGIAEKGNWYQLAQKVWELDPGVRKTFFTNFIVNASLKGSALQKETEEKEDCNVPWAILLDPTSACNLHCTGCWAAEYGHKLNLSLETIDDIVTQGKKLGTYMYIYTGGEPMVRKKDIITICERHPDCEFLSFTNGTLIDEEFCQEMLRVKNFVPAISLEGFETANDGRRGPGVFDKVKHAMQLLKEHNLPFGISTCYTSMNYKDITSEEFYDMIIEAGALFIWFFHYNWLESSFQCCVFFNIFTVFLQSSRADKLNLTSGKRRFQDIRSIQCSLRSTCSDDGMDFINEQQNSLMFFYFLDHILNAFLKFTSVFASRNHAGKI